MGGVLKEEIIHREEQYRHVKGLKDAARAADPTSIERVEKSLEELARSIMPPGPIPPDEKRMRVYGLVNSLRKDMKEALYGPEPPYSPGRCTR